MQMPEKARIAELLRSTESDLTDVLLPFWVERSPDREAGGFLTYFDAEGRPTGQTTKTFLMQIRMLFTMASAHRAGYGGGRCAELARRGADFILEHYWDEEHDGWIWVADRHGHTTVADKVGYGQCFGVYAFSEYGLATGDARGREAAERSYSAICRHMADTRHGGFMEIMRPDWTPERPGRYGGDRKSMDVHMHMMEALTRFYELTGSATHRRRLLEVIDLIVTRMLDPETGLGYMQFSYDFTPLPAILFATEWGSDEAPEDGEAHPLEYTSYGHNVEFAWLLLHAADVLGLPRAGYARVVKPIFDHCVEFGIDPEHGGVYIDGPFDAPPTIQHKQFWQQAEVLIGMLDAYALFGDERYWQAFEDVYRFVFEKFVSMEAGGEWRALLDRDGTPIWDYLGHEWKISYHTVRSMVQVVSRLRGLLAAS
jgi:mannose/cellobiose epimerase-like protein (N-acyl-D-glucosamine 2-epimerase family)